MRACQKFNKCCINKKLLKKYILLNKDSWLKEYITTKKFRPIPAQILEPLRRYDIGAQLEISKPFLDRFMRNIFSVFAQGSEQKYDGIKWLDYIMFKEMLIKGGVVPCIEI